MSGRNASIAVAAAVAAAVFFWYSFSAAADTLLPDASEVTAFSVRGRDGIAFRHVTNPRLYGLLQECLTDCWPARQKAQGKALAAFRVRCKGADTVTVEVYPPGIFKVGGRLLEGVEPERLDYLLDKTHW